MTEIEEREKAAEARALQIAQGAFDSARSGDDQALREALDIGLSVHAKNARGDSLLMLASYHGRHSAASLLLARGADANSMNDKGQTPVAGACFKGDAEMVKLLLDGGAEVDGADPAGRTPLFFAAMFDRFELCEFLLSRGAALDHQDIAGATAADAALAMGAQKTAQLLKGLAHA